MGAYNLSVVDIDLAFVVPGYNHMAAADILDMQVLGVQNLGKVGIPVGEDLDKVGTLGTAAVGKEELDMVFVDALVVVGMERSVQECVDEALDIAD
jgi:hypothetical protein